MAEKEKFRVRMGYKKETPGTRVYEQHEDGNMPASIYLPKALAKKVHNSAHVYITVEEADDDEE